MVLALMSSVSRPCVLFCFVLFWLSFIPNPRSYFLNVKLHFVWTGPYTEGRIQVTKYFLRTKMQETCFCFWLKTFRPNPNSILYPFTSPTPPPLKYSPKTVVLNLFFQQAALWSKCKSHGPHACHLHITSSIQTNQIYNIIYSLNIMISKWLRLLK